jgi:hypothetical protein
VRIGSSIHLQKPFRVFSGAPCVAAAFGPPSGGLVANPAKVDFGNAANNATITHAALMDAQTGDNILDSQPLPNPRTIYANDPVYIDLNQLQFQLQ